MGLFSIFKRKHTCNFKKPIVSRYLSFQSRQIVFECKCGKRIAEKVTVSISEPFPIVTTPLLTQKDINKYLNK